MNRFVMYSQINSNDILAQAGFAKLNEMKITQICQYSNILSYNCEKLIQI